MPAQPVPPQGALWWDEETPAPHPFRVWARKVAAILGRATEPSDLLCVCVGGGLSSQEMEPHKEDTRKTNLLLTLTPWDSVPYPLPHPLEVSLAQG